MNEGSWSPPSWMYRNEMPPDDDAYFENMARVVFMAGLSWKTVDKKWPNFQKAFKAFDIEKVARFDEKKIQELTSDTSIVRHRAKISATVNNAKQFEIIRKRFGSFRQYLDSLDKSNNYFQVMKEIEKRFSRIGPSSARIFLYSVGENIKRPIE